MIKKYRADTQENAIEMARKDLGDDAIVLSIKKVTPKGALSILKNPYVEVTASSVGENNYKVLDEKKQDSEIELERKNKEIEMLQLKLKETEENLKKAIFNLSQNNSIQKQKYKNSLIQFFYDLLRNQEISEKVCEEILFDINEISKIQELNIDFIVKVVYNKIVDILKKSKGNPVSICKTKSKDKNVNKIVFFGTTGVGKTTTIAKISSSLMMKKGLKVGFITLDTYRIAAVEQLKTYAEILNSQVEIIYNLDELEEKIKNLSIINDLIFFDTAGRSHKSIDNMKEIQDFCRKVKDADKYLVLSATSKLEDMINIINKYSEFTDFKLIFTKIDETSCLGNILNIAKMTDKKIAYLTNGQNVPNDFDKFIPEKISKALLGSIYK